MKLNKNNKKEKGFTLIELVVVIAILAILALILIPSLSGYKTKADRSKDEANARNIYTAATLVLEDLPVEDQKDGGEIKKKISEAGLIDTRQIENWEKEASDDGVTIEAEEVGEEGNKSIEITVKVGEGNNAATYPSN